MSEKPISQPSRWTFLTNHAHVLLCVARNNTATAREIAAQVGLTERAVQRILKDLHDGGCLSHTRQGRQNHYQIHVDAPLRHPTQEGRCVRDLLDKFR